MPRGRVPAAAALAIALAVAPVGAAPAGEDDESAAPAAVGVRGEVLFSVQAPAGRIPVPLRATRIQSRVEAAIRAGRTSNDVRVEERDGASDVFAGPDFVFSVWDEDAALAGEPRAALTASRAAALGAMLDRAAAEVQPRSLLLAAGRIGAATAALVLLLVGGRFVLRRWRLRAASLARGRLRALRLGALPGLSAVRIGAATVAALRAVGVLLALVTALAWLSFSLDQLPWTRGPSRAAAAFVVHAIGSVLRGILDYLPSVVYIALFALVARLALRVLRAAFREVEEGRVSIPGFYADWAKPTYNLVRILVLAVAAVAIFPYLPGAGSPAFQSVSIFVGVLFSLGSTASVANVVAGVVLTYMRPFAVGDRIRVAGLEGMVLERSLLVVRLVTDKKEEITLPNATVLGGHVTNLSARARTDGLLVHTSITLGYSVPWRQVHALLVSAARGSDGIRDAPAPFVLQTALDDFFVRYELNATCDAPERLPAVYARLHERIQDRFAEAGVEIMSPHYLAVRDGQDVALPAVHRGSPNVVAPRRGAEDDVR